MPIRTGHLIFLRLWLTTAAIFTGAADPGEFVFNPARVARINLVVTPENDRAMRTRPPGSGYFSEYPYVPAALQFDGWTLTNIAVRVKGHGGVTGALSFKIDFNRYESGLNLDGLKKLNLHNSAFEFTRMADYLSYGAFREFGVPAPRTGWADVSLNGTNLGLFTLVEQVDQDFIERHFDYANGALYKLEPPGGSLQWLDTNFASYANITLQLPDSSTHQSFINFVRAINQEPITNISNVLDLRGFLTYLAGCVVLGNSDAFTEMAHNCLIYESAPGRFTFLPWDMNFGLSPRNSLYPGWSTGWMGSNVTLTTNVLRNPFYHRAYLSILYEFARGPASRERLQSRIDLAVTTLSNRIDRPSRILSYLQFADSVLVQLARNPANRALPQIQISEVQAANAGTIRDNYGQFDDWIELHNAEETDFDLSGCFLSDNPLDFRKWQFPAGTILPAGGYLLLWADENRSQGPLHTNFKLNAGGETLVLTDSDARGNGELDRFTFPALAADVSAGRILAPGRPIIRFNHPTPLAVNDISDFDSDDMPDGWESAFNSAGLEPGEDLDADGLANLTEFQRGTNPVDGSSPPRLERFGGASFRWTRAF